MTTNMHEEDFDSPSIRALREDLSLALRAAAHHGLSEGVCNHFSVELPDDSGRFLLNPRGLLWSEIQAEDIVMIDEQGEILAGRHPVEPTAMFIHAAVHRIAKKTCVLHTHMPYACHANVFPRSARRPVAGRPAGRPRSCPTAPTPNSRRAPETGQPRTGRVRRAPVQSNRR